MYNVSDKKIFLFRFIAKKVGLVGKTQEDFFMADMVLEHTGDFFNCKSLNPKHIWVNTSELYVWGEGVTQHFLF